ncbi:MAG: hypothetical protein ACO1SV_22300 [Fimbriimonas sp.]
MMRTIKRTLLAIAALGTMAASADAFWVRPTYSNRVYNSGGNSTWFFPPNRYYNYSISLNPSHVSYLTAGGPEAQALCMKLSQLWPTWGFGTGQTLAGHMLIDGLAAFALPYGSGTPHIKIYSRYEEYPTGIWGSPQVGAAGLVHVPPNELRVIVRNLRGNGSTSWENWSISETTPDGLPFFWTEAEDAGVTNNYIVYDPPVPPPTQYPYTKYYGDMYFAPFGATPPPYFGPAITQPQRVEMFLCRYQNNWGIPSVTVYDGIKWGGVASM